MENPRSPPTRTVVRREGNGCKCQRTTNGRGKTSGRSKCLGEEAIPVGLPSTTLLQRFDGHERLGVVAVPAHAPALDPLPRRLAHRLRRPTADLPALLRELLVA